MKKTKNKQSSTANDWEPLKEIKKHQKHILNINDILYFLKRIIYAAFVVFVVLGLIFGVKPVTNEDMKPVMNAGDVAIYYRWDRNFVSQDLVVYSSADGSQIGRVVARPGDEVNIPDAGGLAVNGYNSYEENIYYETKGYEDGISFPVRMNGTEYFLLADHRDGARDSRYYGAIDDRAIKGKVIMVIRWVAL